MARPAREGRIAILIRRRQFIVTLGGAIAAWPLAARGQQAGTTRRIGALIAFAKDDPDTEERLAAFRQGLAKRGWVEGRNIHIDYRFAAGRGDQFPVLAKELERAGRYGDAVSLILFDVDRLSTINEEHGHGVGDRILERVGILIRQYFRQQDWVARHSDDSFAVLLTRTDAEHVTELAERVRATVEERLGFTDHRTDRPVVVTLSAAVINLRIAIGDVIDPERLLADAEIAVDKAKQQGRNRVQRVDGYSGPLRSDPPAPGT